MQVVKISEPVTFVQPPLKELEPLLILGLTNSNIDFTCYLYCDPSIYNKCVEVNKFLTIHCEDYETRSEMELSTEPDYTETTKNSSLFYMVQQFSLEEKQRFLTINVDYDNLEEDVSLVEDATVFSCLRFHRHPLARPPPPPHEVTPVLLSTTPRSSSQPFHHPFPPMVLTTSS